MARLLCICFVLVSVVPSLGAAATITFSIISGGSNVGHLSVEVKGDLTTVDFDVKNNGRGPTISEVIRTGPEGLPLEWSIEGSTTFGSKVKEHFNQTASHAEWMDSTGQGSATINKPALYVNQSGSPWLGQIAAHALLRAPVREAAPGDIVVVKVHPSRP